MIKIAVIGGGTAGYIAAAHITKHFPNFRLYHIYDSRIPTIGVGEGTTLYLPQWLSAITGLSYSELEEKCYLIPKFGIKFENWGIKHEQFMHNFYPIGSTHAYHLSAEKLVELLKEYVSATHIDNKVIEVKSNGVEVNITFEDNTNLEVDLAIDARGFPKSIDNNHIQLSWIPTNAAVIRQGPVVDRVVDIRIGDRVFKYQSATRTIARPHGWIFVIPLTTRTSYGYIYNSSINSVSEIETDFEEFLQLEGVTCVGSDKHLHFPNFTQRTFFDGALFKLGNAASFIEPLEATAIGFILNQVEVLSYWPLRHLAKLEKRGKLNENDLKVFNRYLLNFACKISIFVGWHYVSGSRFDTEFWQFAKSNFKKEIEKMPNQELIREFRRYLQAGTECPHPIENFSEFSKLAAADPLKITHQLRGADPIVFAQWRHLSFAEVGYGIGYFS